ncbi:hypothetical protein [Spirulina sp. 06S082]|uniref:hypothetical protein n=1 Tax=Spirulina sp. 06S082 TaxID=3110248 RepID=UPI002B2053DB|nr:hypothetical protein [Spirulina sp. 06S082]MEA5471495.1 hypothetical protein [Spirulina sp. 06S082]
MRKWVVFRAEKRQPGWENRKLQHTQSLTKILAEHLDSSDSDIPEPGYRPPEFVRVEQLSDSQYPAANTHYRQGDWEVVRVETYTPEIPLGEFDMVVICYCQYAPINADLKPMPDRRVTVDSFAGDEMAYQDWLKSQEKTAIEV